jgi:formate-dependent nitrite reductase membrane component NrfD
MTATDRRSHDAASYYGRPILKEPTWQPADIAGYLFAGGLAGASSVLAAGAQFTRRPRMARWNKVGALGALGASLFALVHDLGRPSRFYNMLRVAKPSSPMSVGSWLLAGYGPLAGLSAVSDLTGRVPRLGRGAGVGAAVLGAGVATYTSVLIADTAVPAWHEARRSLPFVFAGSAAASAAGLALVGSSTAESAPATRAAAGGALLELAASALMERTGGIVAETYHTGRAGALLTAAKVLTGAGAIGALAGRRRRLVSMASGAALLAGSALTRFGIFEAGRASTRDPRFTVRPQRERLAQRG